VVILLRTLLGVLVAVAAAAVAVPILVLADLAGSGSGWGLCPDGLFDCSTSYFAGPELLMLLLVVLFVTLGGAALCVRAIRRIEARQ
jgi:hypothetical protein